VKVDCCSYSAIIAGIIIQRFIMSTLPGKLFLKIVSISALSSVMLGCGASNWVQLTAPAQQVSLALPAQVTNCTRVGTSTANALDKLAFLQRGSQKLQEELVTLARNEAADMGGNRVVAESTITEGRQTFGVFRC
jgi:hypothetical protein